MPYEFPIKYQFLFTPARYKVCYGGRGAGRSWNYARALLRKGLERPLKILCVRELQNSISESVHSLLEEQIELMGFSQFYKIEKAHIYGPNGTQIDFEGIARNVNKIRSYEGCDICWAEEANKISRNSWRVLIPTIRKDGSEIWVTFNPEFETDETYQRFVAHPPTNSIVEKANWQDNPWFPSVLKQEMEDLKTQDYDEYLHVYEGHTIVSLKGAVYAKELREAREENRITQVPWQKSVPVDTFWDLGRQDKTGIWFAQRVAMQYRVLRYFEDSGEDIWYYLKELDKLPYTYGTHFLPHDAKQKRIGERNTVEQIVRANGKRSVKVVPMSKIFNGINAARGLFDECWFDQDNCSAGLMHLQRYRYGVGEDGSWSNEPLHDEHSHAADAFRYMAMAFKAPKENRSLAEMTGSAAERTMNLLRNNALGWMA